MITKILDDNSISLIPEESDDLLILRRIIKTGDRIVGTTSRVIKQDKEYSRPDRGDRVKIRIALDVEKISLDNVLDRLRVTGKIAESNNESVPHGSHHSFLIKVNEGFNLIKKHWEEVEKKLIHSKEQKFGFLLIAIDTSDCGIGRLKGTHLELTPNIYSGASGKQYKSNFNIEKFFDIIQRAVFSSLKEGDTIIIFGPGETKKKFSNYIQKTSVGQKHKIQVIEGIDSGGEDGIYTFTKSQSMKEIMSESKLAKVSSIIDEIMYRANKKSRKFTMGFEETKNANQFGAIDSLVFSEKIIQTEDEEKIIEFLNDAESKGVKAYSADSTTDVGLRVTGLGGIVSLLRFPVEA
ncbi:MAG: eRF1 domain-containing protein, protein pelota [Thaumarchaeota archaeon CSP1-1]|jgi:protein pelota|nr:MAG: eRF1 domain-containing protein, protein pelota [Thaumarchaeota archaeon CSP1-1]